MRNLLNLFQYDKKDWEVLRWWTSGESLGVYSVFILRMSFLDKRLDVTSVISSACLLRFVLQKGLTVDFESLQVLVCLGKSEQENNNASCFLAQFLAGGLEFTLVDGKNELRLFLMSYNVAFWSL